MLKTLMMSAAVGALMISGALAQANPPVNPPAAMKNGAADTSSPKFIQAQGTDKWVFSKFKGTDVLGPDNAKVGSISDLLFDHNGKIEGLIVGVGGFLGIGEKNVAIDMSAFQVMPYSASTTGTNASASDSDPHSSESEGDVDEGSAQGSARFSVLPRSRTHDGAARNLADDGDGATACARSGGSCTALVAGASLVVA